MEAHAIPEVKPFSRAAAGFAELARKLGDASLDAAHHGKVEELIWAEGLETLRLLYEDHMNMRALSMPQEPEVTGSDGKTRTHKRDMPRKQMSRFGTITIHHRKGFRARDADALSPFDAQLNMPSGLSSHGVRRRVAELASMSSFDTVGTELSKTTGASAGKRQLEETTHEVSLDFDAFYEAKQAEPVTASATLLVSSVDATGIAMRPEALREATRRAHEAQAAKPERWPKPKRAGDMRKNGMRMVAVSAVYEVEPYVRQAQDILRDLRPVRGVDETEPKKRRPKPQAKRVSASVIKPMETVVRENFDDMQRRDPAHEKRWVVLVDGAEHQLDLIETEAKRRSIAITIVIDFIHVAQYVWGAAKALVPDDEVRRREWVLEKLTLVLWGQSSTAAAAMRRSATMRRMAPSDRQAVDDCADYLLKYNAYLAYDAALRDGLPITSGVIEGACRHLCKDRLDITGARWGLDTAEAVLRLRALVSNGDIDDYFDFHEHLELERNHLSRYADAKPPTLVRSPGAKLRVVT